MIEIGVDIGGTFTDVVCRASGTSGERTKVPTTRRTRAARCSPRSAADWPRSGASAAAITRFAHGTTVATNAVLERRGPDRPDHDRGFRDVLEDRPADAPPDVRRGAAARDAGVPRARRHAQGGVGARRRPTARCWCRSTRPRRSGRGELAARGVEAIAVCFLFSFLNPGA